MRFLGVEPGDCQNNTPLYRLIPFGLEKTVTFGTGTCNGPNGILSASQEIELFDVEYLEEIYRAYGVETAQSIDIADDHADAIWQLQLSVTQALAAQKIPVVLGGEHSITLGPVAAVSEHLGAPLTIIQFDAHCDLHDAYEGNIHSHASVMRRCLELPNTNLISIGIRNISAEEFTFYQNAENIHIFTSEAAMKPGFLSKIGAMVAGRNVYVSFDVDCLDPSIMPSTGTPEPGGLGWNLATDTLRILMSQSKVVGMDIVELAPIPGLLAPDFLAAKLIYKMMSYAFQTPREHMVE